MAIIRRANHDEAPTRQEGAVPMVESHAGLVVGLDSRYMGDGDSTYLAVVYDPSADRFETVGYCSTYCSWSGHNLAAGPGRCRAEVDAAPALMARRAAELAAAREARERSLRISAEERRYHAPDRGAVVRVVAGRKVPEGTEGRVFWSGPSQFGERVGIELPDGRKEFTATANVEVIARPGEPPHRCGEDPGGR